MKASHFLLLTGALALAAATAANAAILASDNASDAAYDGGFSNGADGGAGTGAWAITTGANSSSFTSNSRANGFGAGRGINTPGGDAGRAFGLSASDGDVARATLPLDAPVPVGATVRFGMDYGFAETGGVASAALRNASGEDLLVVSFTGGGAFAVTDGAGANDTGLGFSSDGFFVEVTLDGPTAYTAVITKYNDGSVAVVSGNLLAPAGGQAVSQLSFAASALAPSGASGDQGWYFNFNKVAVDDNTDAPMVVASDDAADPAYAGGLASGLNGGTGLGPWTVTTGGNSLALVANSRSNGFNGGQGINTPGGDSGAAWGLAASDGDVASAVRPFAAPMAAGDIVRMGLDYGFAEGGGVVGASLRNAAGQDLLTISFTGGGAFAVTDASGPRDTGLGFSSDGFLAEVVLDSATTYTAVITKLNDGSVATLSGSLIPAGSGTAPAQARFFCDNIAPSGFFADPGWYFYFNSLEILEASTSSSVTDWFTFE